MLKIKTVIGVELKVSENIIQYVNAACNGDTDAMAKLYSRTLKSSYFLAETLCAGEGSAEDITKKAYARAFSTIDKLKRPEAFEIWMKQNVALVYKEGQKFVFTDAEAGADEASSDFLSESVLENDELCEKIIEGIGALKPVLRTALVLHYNNGMPVQALAKFLGVSESTANALLSKARSELLSYCSIEAVASEHTKSLPVLTRILQHKAVATVIDNASVRDIFIYAIDAYEASKPAAPAVAEESVSPVPEKAEETVAEETAPVQEAPAENEKLPEEPEAQTSNIISFKQKINEILDSETPASEPDEFVDIKSDSGDEDENEIPVITPGESSSFVSEETLNIFSEQPKSQPIVKEEKKSKLKINPKLIGIICAALVVVIIIAVAIGGKDKPETGKETINAGESQTQQVAASGYKWVEGGFAECTEITYLDENCFYFKSVSTGKYGLADYQGNVILQPHYDGFERCSSGRDYSQRNSYHSLVKIDNEGYEFTILDGSVTISQTPHTAHPIDDKDSMGDDVSYDERDRYFEGYAAARKDDKWGYVSQENDKKVIKYEYEAVNELRLGEPAACDYCRPVTGGLVAVKKDGKMGIIDLKNKTVVPFEFTNIMPGNDGVFIACKDGIWGTILVGNAITEFKGVNISVEKEPVSDPDNQDESVLGSYKVVSEDGANIRTGAGAEFDKVDEDSELSYGDVVEGYATKEAENGKDWLCIKYKGEYAWVAMSNLEAVEE